MTIVDTHCHAGVNWFEPVELLMTQMNLNGVDKGALIQHRGTYDNGYLFECTERFPGRFAVVAIVDTASESAESDLERWTARGACGVRLAPLERSPGSDPLAIWRKASELGLLVSSLGSVEEFAAAEFENAVASFPDMPIIIEHLAGGGGDAQPPYSTYKKALALSKYPNTYIKVPGLGEVSERSAALGRTFSFEYTPPLYEMALDSFGPRRMMWGSDYPPVSGREGYRNALEGVKRHPAFRDPDTLAWILGKTAQSLFRFL